MDLFGDISPAVPGLGFRPDAISAADEKALVAEMDVLDMPHFQFQGWLSNRRTKSFGWQYNFNNSSFAPSEPIPGFLQPLKEIAAKFADVEPETIVQASLIKYEPDAGIGWHIDRPELDAVIGISFGAPATMRFRRRKEGGFERASILLPPRSIYHLDGEVRYDWEHSIAPMRETRWSVTFRELSEKGKTKATKAKGVFHEQYQRA